MGYRSGKTRDIGTVDRRIRAAQVRGVDERASQGHDLIREVFAVGGLGVHVDRPAVVVAGLAEIADGRLMAWQRETITQI
jgi:hypothetical protein